MKNSTANDLNDLSRHAASDLVNDDKQTIGI
jgi:hypothetical protein